MRKNETPKYGSRPEKFSLAESMELFKEAARRWDAELQTRKRPRPETVQNAFLMIEMVLRSYCHPDN